jgi:hypothetical protein
MSNAGAPSGPARTRKRSRSLMASTRRRHSAVLRSIAANGRLTSRQAALSRQAEKRARSRGIAAPSRAVSSSSALIAVACRSQANTQGAIVDRRSTFRPVPSHPATHAGQCGTAASTRGTSSRSRP